MLRLGANQPRIGTFNERVIIDSLRRVPGQSLTGLSTTTGLAVPTVSGLLKQLTSRGLVRAIGTQPIGGRGRPRTKLALVPEARFSVGIHLDPTMTTIAILDLAGRARSTRLVQGALDDAPDVVIGRLAASTRAMVETEGIDPERVVGAGIASPGPVDLARGRLVDPPWLPGWEGVALQEELARALGMDVLFEKDTIAAVTGETWLRRDDRGAQVMVFVYVGIGMGVGVSVNGEVLRGATGNAGEIGLCFEIESPRGEDLRASDGAYSSVDPSHLLSVARAGGILAAIPDWEDGSGDTGHSPATAGEALRPRLEEIDHGFRELCRVAAGGSPGARSLLEEAGTKVAQMVALLVDLMDADTVVLGGPYWEQVRSFYEPAIQARLAVRRRGQVRRNVTMSTSLMGESAGAIGAAAMVFDERYVPRATMLSSAE